MTPVLHNKGFNGNSQLGMFLGLWGTGLLAGSLVAAGIWTLMTGQGIMNMTQDMLNPKYATAVKVFQLVSTLFIFFIPAAGYAFICYRNGWLALGFNGRPALKLSLISLLILVACMPAIDALTQLNQLIPLPAKSRLFFDDIERSYEDQVKVIGDVKTTAQYLLSLFMIAMLPAIFEEILFRGGLQNMLSRFKKQSIVYVVITVLVLIGAKNIWWTGKINPWLFYGGILVGVLLIYRSATLTDHLNKLTGHFLFPVFYTSILFSAVHASWYGFLPRVGLGILLGLIFYYTQNIFYTILVHFANNATVITLMFINAGKPKNMQATGEFSFPWWTALFSLLALVFLYRWLFYSRVNEKPTEVIPDYQNPFDRAYTDNEKEEAE